MKIIKVLIIMFVLLFPALTSARIGETFEQCEARYGKLIAESGLLNGFSKNGFTIAITFYNLKADMISYYKDKINALDIPEEISENEIAILLKINGGDKEWVKYDLDYINNCKRTKDGSMFSAYDTFNHYLIIMTKEYIERLNKNREAEEIEQLEEF